MGCGCKNKGSATQNSVESTQVQVVQASHQQQSNQHIKETIKKTVEKYYRKDTPIKN